MSIYTTQTVSRKMAIQMLVDKLEIKHTNEQLGDLLDDAYSDETMFNYMVVDDHMKYREE
jgi:hypothetical protein